jgi:hypothetical protein
LNMGRSYKAETGKRSFTDPANTPAEMMTEALERRVFTAEFDDCELAFFITAGKDGKNAVMGAWKDPIRDHDVKVLEVETLIEVFTEKNRAYRKEIRTIKNWETGV